MLPVGYPHEKVKQERDAGKKAFPHLLAIERDNHSLKSMTKEIITPEKKEADKKQIMRRFPTNFNGECRPMNGLPCHFVLKDGAISVAMRGSRPVAVPLMPQVKDELDTLEEQSIIEKLTKPTAWVHPIVLVPKRSGGIRLCVDFRNVKKSIVRPTFETTTPFQAVCTIPPGMK